MRAFLLFIYFTDVILTANTTISMMGNTHAHIQMIVCWVLTILSLIVHVYDEDFFFS